MWRPPACRSSKVCSGAPCFAGWSGVVQGGFPRWPHCATRGVGSAKQDAGRGPTGLLACNELWVGIARLTAHLCYLSSATQLPAEAILGNGSAIEYERQRYLRALQQPGDSSASGGSSSVASTGSGSAAAEPVADACPLTVAWLKETLQQVGGDLPSQCHLSAQHCAACWARFTKFDGPGT